MTANAPDTATSVDVCIPWRPQPDRLAAYDRVTRFWRDNGYRTITADSDRRRKAFSICEARNNAVKQSVADVVIVADADTIPDLGAVHDAIRNLADDEVCWPYTAYRHLPASAVTVSDLHSITPDREYRASVGGLFITRRDTYWRLGGMDQRFEPRWGYEDNAFEIVARNLGTVRRLLGVVYSFNHAADRDLTYDNRNRHRYDLYRAVDKRPELVRELIK